SKEDLRHPLPAVREDIRRLARRGQRKRARTAPESFQAWPVKLQPTSTVDDSPGGFAEEPGRVISKERGPLIGDRRRAHDREGLGAVRAGTGLRAHVRVRQKRGELRAAGLPGDA